MACFYKIRSPLKNKIALSAIKYRSGLQSSNCLKLLLTCNLVVCANIEAILFCVSYRHLNRSETIFMSELVKF